MGTKIFEDKHIHSSCAASAMLIAATSITVLAYEIILMRLLSIGLWSHFAYMVISMALLGFGASGSILFLVYDRIRFDLNGWLISLSAVLAVSFSFFYSLSQRIPLDPLELLWQPIQWVHMLTTYTLMAIPFFLAGGIIGIILTGTVKSVHQMYAIDLLGAGCGALMVIPALFTGPPWRLLPFLGYIVLLGAVGYCRRIHRPVIGLGTLFIAGLILTIVYVKLPPVPKIHEAKALPMALSLPDARIEATRKGPMGIIDVVGSAQIRHVPGLSLNFGLELDDQEAKIPEQKGIFIDADGLSPITSFSGNLDELRHLDYTSMALPYHIRNLTNVLVVGSGGGADILLGLFHHVSKITCIEANQQIADLLLGPFAVFSGHLYARPEIILKVQEARQFLYDTEEKFDLIQFSLIDSFVNSAGGLHSASEDYLYTVEAFGEYLSHLSESGLLAVTRWIKFPPRDSLRTLTVGLEALQRMDLSDPGKHILFIRSWKTFTILISPLAFQSEEVARTRDFCALRGFDLAYYKGMKPEEANQYDIQDIPYYYNGADAICGKDAESFINHYPFDVSVVTDDRPYFSHFFRWKKALALFQHLKREGLLLVGMGYVFILATLGQAVLAAILLILAPLIIFRWIQGRCGLILKPSRFLEVMGPLIYFASIGIGFMFFEMVFIPQYTLLLSHPVYAAGVVLAAVLIFAGFGSLSVKRFPLIHIRFLWIPMMVVLCWVLIYIMMGSRVFHWVLGFPFPGRLTITMLFILIPSYFLGWFFPSGLRVLAHKQPGLIPWAWGVNGCSSVIGAVLGKSLAVTMGFHFVMIIACLLYALAVSTLYLTFRVHVH